MGGVIPTVENPDRSRRLLRSKLFPGQISAHHNAVRSE